MVNILMSYHDYFKYIVLQNRIKLNLLNVAVFTYVPRNFISVPMQPPGTADADRARRTYRRNRISLRCVGIEPGPSREITRPGNINTLKQYFPGNVTIISGPCNLTPISTIPYLSLFVVFRCYTY